MQRSGVADLPLHGGRVPAWLAERMTRLGTAISECILHHYGTAELLTRLSDPFWFQALGCVMGMDWHSSGITTSVLGALKRGLNPRAGELGRTSAEAAGGIRATHRRAAGGGGAARARRPRSGADQPADRQGRQQRHRRRLPDLPAHIYRGGFGRVGGGAAGHERRAGGAPLPLAFAKGARLRLSDRTRGSSASTRARFSTWWTGKHGRLGRRCWHRVQSRRRRPSRKCGGW